MVEAVPVADFCWANDAGRLGLSRPEALEAQGWTRVRRHPRWHDSWLMRKDPA